MAWVPEITNQKIWFWNWELVRYTVLPFSHSEKMSVLNDFDPIKGSGSDNISSLFT